MKRIITVTVSAILIVVAGYAGYIKFEQRKFQSSITPHVKNVSLRLTNVSHYEIKDDTRITYKEIFDKLESDISEIDQQVLEVQTITTPEYKSIAEPVLEYMKSSQELIRALLQKNRKELAFTSAKEWSEKASDNLKDAGYYGREYALKSWTESIKDLSKAIEEYKSSISDVVAAAIKTKSLRVKVAPHISSDALAESAILDAIAKKNKKSLEFFNSDNSDSKQKP